MLGHDDLRRPLVRSTPELYNRTAVQEHHDVGVLLERVVGDQAVGHEVVRALDGGVEDRPFTERRDVDDAVPLDVRHRQIAQPRVAGHGGQAGHPLARDPRLVQREAVVGHVQAVGELAGRQVGGRQGLLRVDVLPDGGRDAVEDRRCHDLWRDAPCSGAWPDGGQPVVDRERLDRRVPSIVRKGWLALASIERPEASDTVERRLDPAREGLDQSGRNEAVALVERPQWDVGRANSP